MNRALLLLLFVCLVIFPVLASAAEVTGTLGSYSIKGKVLVVDNNEYFVDLENLNITYSGEYTGIDALKPGIRVQLIFSDEASTDQESKIVRMRILTHQRGLDN